MRLAELARRSGLTTSTVKWYLRIGLVPPGERTAKNQAQYDESHLRRLVLVRTLIEAGGIGTESARAIVSAVDDPEIPPLELIKIAHAALASPRQQPDAESVARASRFVDARGWRVDADSPSLGALAQVMAGLEAVIGSFPGQPAGDDSVLEEILAPYAAAVEGLARAELDGLAQQSGRSDMVVRVVAGTVMLEGALTALHRLAQEHFAKNVFTQPD